MGFADMEVNVTNAVAAHDVPEGDRRTPTRGGGPSTSASRPAPLGAPAALLQLQRSAGNRAVSSMMASRAQPTNPSTGAAAPESAAPTVEPLPGGAGTRPLPTVP